MWTLFEIKRNQETDPKKGMRHLQLRDMAEQVQRQSSCFEDLCTENFAK